MTDAEIDRYKNEWDLWCALHRVVFAVGEHPAYLSMMQEWFQLAQRLRPVPTFEELQEASYEMADSGGYEKPWGCHWSQIRAAILKARKESVRIDQAQQRSKRFVPAAETLARSFAEKFKETVKENQKRHHFWDKPKAHQPPEEDKEAS